MCISLVYISSETFYGKFIKMCSRMSAENVQDKTSYQITSKSRASSYDAQKYSFWSLFIFDRLLTREPASVPLGDEQGDLFYSAGPRGKLCKWRKDWGLGEGLIDWQGRN